MFFNSRNGQGHLLRYFQHRFFVNSSQDEYAAALGGQRLDDRLYLTQCFAGLQLCFDRVFAAQQFQIGDRFEADDLVAAGGVDDEVAGDREQIGAASRHIFPIVRCISAGQDFGNHILQFVRGREYPAQATTQGGFLWQDDRLEPFQFCPNPMHVDPLISSAAPLQHFLMFLLYDVIQSCSQALVQRGTR